LTIDTIGKMNQRPKDVVTERLLLQPLSIAHVKRLYDAIIDSRPELLPWMPWARAPTVASTRRYIRAVESAGTLAGEYHWVVLEQPTELVLGVVGLNRVDASADFELHYWIRSDRTGRGFATEACGAIVRWGVELLQASRFTLWAGRDNSASRRVAEKVGFTSVGPLSWAPQGGAGSFPAEAYELTVATPLLGTVGTFA